MELYSSAYWLKLSTAFILICNMAHALVKDCLLTPYRTSPLNIKRSQPALKGMAHYWFMICKVSSFYISQSKSYWGVSINFQHHVYESVVWFIWWILTAGQWKYKSDRTISEVYPGLKGVTVSLVYKCMEPQAWNNCATSSSHSSSGCKPNAGKLWKSHYSHNVQGWPYCSNKTFLFYCKINKF